MKQQTAVEWIIEQLQAPCRGIPSHIIEQAKQMEKEQIIDAYCDGNPQFKDCGEEYYDDAYGKQEIENIEYLKQKNRVEALIGYKK